MVGWRRVALSFLFLLLVVSAATATTDEERLATLASHMLNLTGTKDYSMACSKNGGEVLYDTRGQLANAPVCVMNLSGQVILGTFGETASVRTTVLTALNGTPYVFNQPGQVMRNIKVEACKNVGSSAFAECPSAITSGYGNFRVYAFDDNFETDVTYLLISDKPVANLVQSKTFFGGVWDFFKDLFGWSG